MVLFVAAAHATTYKVTDSLVLGLNLTVALGEVPQGSRLGAGFDLWRQRQGYVEYGVEIDGDFTVWAEEGPALNHGPAVHVWRVGGAWHSSLGWRVGVCWPLRVGLGGGWYPGPGLAAELGVMISTSGDVALDAQGALDLPWTQARLGVAGNWNGLLAPRAHLGLFHPLARPQPWDVDDVWDADVSGNER